VLKKCFLIVFLLSTKSHAGWFSPSPQELFVKESLDVEAKECTSHRVTFDERSTYKASITFEEEIDFHSEQGKTISWPIKFAISIEVLDQGESLYNKSYSEPLDHNLGLGIEWFSVPKDLPKNKELVFRFCPLKVAGEFHRVYGNVNLVILKAPYVLLSF